MSFIRTVIQEKMLNCAFSFTACCSYGCSFYPWLWGGEIRMLLVANSPCLERKRGASRSSWSGPSIRAVPDYLPRCSPKSCQALELGAHKRTWCVGAVLCRIPALMQLQMKMVSRPEEGKGLFITGVDMRSLLLPQNAAENASQCLI